MHLDHDHLGAAHEHHHDHCGHNCGGCESACHTPIEELVALMKYMVGHNAAHANELASLAKQLDEISDFEKGNLRLSTVLAALHQQ